MKLFTALLLAPLLATTLSNGAPVNALQVPVRDILGKEIKLADLGGKAVLIVNVASECGYTAQYEGLEALYKSLKARGLIVVGVPCNDFGSQEPGSNDEIRKFCSTRFQVTFPLLSKVSIKGPEAHPLFRALTGEGSPLPGPVTWNFQKFLLSKDGRLEARFESSVEPDSAELKASIEKVLAR
jgi:glutathione peroxidase